MSSIEKHRITGSFDEQIDKNIIKEIEGLYSKIDENSEFEVMLYNYKQDQNRMGLEQFLKILGFMSYRRDHDKLEMENIIELDINYAKKSGESYRITISGIESINKYIRMLHVRKNHVIFTSLLGLMENDKTIRVMKKLKKKENIIDVDDFDTRFRLSSETDISKKELDELKKLNEADRDDIVFRYKQRASLKIENKKDVVLSLDLTNIKMTKNINRLEEIIPVYELEIDLSSHAKSVDKKYLGIIYSEITTLLKVIGQNNHIVSRSLEREVIDSYKNLLNVSEDKMISLDGRKSQSLEVQHVVDQLPNKYSVTDKADGERYFLIIHRQVVFLISDLLVVKNTGIVLSDKKYNDTIIDGELVFIQSVKKHVFLAFDCLYKEGKDIRQTISHLERLEHLDDIIEKCFVMKGHNGYKLKSYGGKFDMNEILKYYGDDIAKYMNALNHDLGADRQLLVRRKYFIAALGGQPNEIFKYANLLWNKYTHDKAIHCPYILDGLIFTPLNQKYVTSVKESEFIEYKWKPEEKNSVDFFVQYERSKDTHKIVTLYDNSKEEDESLKDKPYKVLKLFVGKMLKGFEQPVLFEPETDSIKYQAYIFLEDGEARDIEGNIIQDNTVVEFYYNNDPNIPDKHRWVPMRTRYDKTESVQRFGKKYGNYSDIAYKVWRSIRNPFSISDINLLSKDDIYQKHIEILRGKIDHSIILSERKENIYYQKRTTLGKPMRNFHNWIKSILIYTFINPMYEQSKDAKLSVLDIACGRGGDIMRYYYGQVDFMVGIDIDNNGLTSPVDGALSRYNQFKKNKPNFPRMFFIHADGGVLLNKNDQIKALGGMSPNNEKLFSQFFSDNDARRTKFDRISCQMAIHYFFENDTIFDNFTQNINDYLKPGGYLVATTFDADRIVELLSEKHHHTQFFTTQTGEQEILFDIVQKYDGINKGDEIGVGVAIDFHNAIDFQEGVYMTEYLVQKDFIQKEFLKRCDLELVETDLFENQYIMNNDFLKEVHKYEDNEKTRKFMSDAAEYYLQKSDINSASYKLTRLYRYYVFRRKDNGDTKPMNNTNNSKPTKKKELQKGGKVKISDSVFNDTVDILNPTKFIKRNIEGINHYSFMSSVHDILKTHKIVPDNLSMMDFYSDISYDAFLDKDVDEQKINKLSKHLTIKHDYSASDMSSEVALDGLNILMVSKDCDGSSIVSQIGRNKSYPMSIIYYDGNKYYPIYKVKEGELIGMFNGTANFIKNMITKG